MALTKISTGGVKDDAASQAKIADEAIDEARLQVSNAGTNGQFLQKSSGTGGLTWATVDTNLSSDTTPQLGGDVDTNDHNIEFKDRNGTDDANVLNFGAGDDMRLYSDGTNGYLQADTELRIGTASSTTNAVFTSTKFDFRQDVDITNSKKLGIGGSYGSSGQVLTSGGSGAAPSWAAVPPAGNTFTAVANGSIANNKAVKLDTDGKVSQIAESVTNHSVPTKIGSGSDTAIVQFTLNDKYAQWMRIARISDTQYACLWWSSVDEKIRSRIFTVNGESFSVHTPLTDTPEMQELATDEYARDLDIVYDSNRSKLLAVWTDSNHHCVAKVGTVSGTGTSATITWDSSTTTIRSGSSSSKTRNNCLVWNEDLNNFGYFYYTDASPDKYYGKIVTINSSGGIELGTELDLTFSNDDFPIGTIYSLDAVYDTTNNRFGVWLSAIDSNSTTRYRGMGVCLSASGSGTSAALTKQSGHQGNIAYWRLVTSYNHSKYAHFKCCYIPENDLVAVTYQDTADWKVKMRFFQSNDTNVDFNFGSETTFLEPTGNTTMGLWSMVYSPGINKPVVFYVDTDGKLYSFILNISGNTHSATYTKSNITTLHSNTDWYRKSAAGWNSQSTNMQRAVASASGGQLFFPCINGSSISNRESYIVSAKVQDVTPNFTAADTYVGFADAAYTNGQTVTVKTYGNNVSTLSGLTIGSKYYVQHNGTVGTTAPSTNAIAGIAIAADKLLIREPT